MPNKPNKPEDHPFYDLMFSKHLRITLRVIAITVGTMVILGGGGYILDKQIGTSPLLMVTGLILAFPLTQIIIYKRFRQLAGEISKPKK